MNKNYFESYEQILKEILLNGENISTRGLVTRELINITIRIDSLHTIFHSITVRPYNQVKKYLLGELCWYFSGSKNVNEIIKYSKFWDKLKDDENKVNSNYGYLVFYKENKYELTQYNWCKKTLEQDVNSRQAIIMYNQPEYFYKENKDFICAQLQHFFIRDNKLSSIIYIRSSDAILGLTYDIPWFSLVQQYLCLELNMKYDKLMNGNLTVNIGSSHIYENKIALVKSMLSNGIEKEVLLLKKVIPLFNSQKWYEDNLLQYVIL